MNLWFGLARRRSFGCGFGIRLGNRLGGVGGFAFRLRAVGDLWLGGGLFAENVGGGGGSHFAGGNDFAFIGRLDPQKGLDLVRHAIFFALEHGAQFVLLGSSPYQEINDDFWGLKLMLNDSPDCHLEIGFDEELSHLIYAGADLMLVPSQFEPCGLTQLIALRYGTVPIVRAVGGLADTVFDKDYSDRPIPERNGYVFEHYDQPGLESALGRAISDYSATPEVFQELVKNGMQCDYSWNQPGRDYLNIYDYIREK